MVTAKLCWIETQDKDPLLVFHDAVFCAFKFGGNRRFFVVDTVGLVWCRGRPGFCRIRHPCHVRYLTIFLPFLPPLPIFVSAPVPFSTGHEPGVLSMKRLTRTINTSRSPKIITMSDSSQTSSEGLFKHKEATFPRLNLVEEL